MKLRDYKTLLSTDKRAAMLFDLTERFPRGPTTKLRASDYKDTDGDVLSNGWGSNESPYLNRGVASAENSPMTGGWSPYDIFELPDSEWNVAHLLQEIVVAEHIAMGLQGYRDEEGTARLFKSGAQLTRRSRRLAQRVRSAKKWVEENITTAVYQVNFGWRSRTPIFVHADSNEGAVKQFELFMASAFNEHCSGWTGADEVRVEYVRPAKTPLELMALNAPFQEAYREAVEAKKKQIIKLQQEIESMDTAEQIVNIYAVNMVATWGTGEGEGEDA
tara:strand:+ start:3324 stop:4148 length:825 start_codon:yes stop_codon:yes gene_type:complete